ncbi:MAG: SDR family NAD(P)-dependent oxidoreductase [Bacillota bacterium]
MDFGLKGKTAIVTGGARGIGRADCHVLSREGAKVAIFDILQEEAEKTAQAIRDEGGEARAFYVDISDRELVNRQVGQVAEMYGSVDILINNAAICDTIASITKYDDEQWKRDLEVNLTGMYYITKAVFPIMKRNRWGRIVSMSSVVGMLGGYGQASYTTSKIGVVGFARTIALEGARYNITSNIIAPGIIGSEIFLNSISDPVKDEVRGRTAFGREGETWDIANATAFLCSEQAKYITGVILPVMGGLDLFTILPHN